MCVQPRIGTTMHDRSIEESQAYIDLNNQPGNAVRVAGQKKLKDDAHEAWLAMIFLMNADQKRYGTLMDDLQDSFTRNRDEYPKTLEGVMDLLDNRKIVNKKSQAEDINNKSDAEEDKENKTKTDSSFAQKNTIEPKCICCNEGHHYRSCPIKNKFAYDVWFKNTGKDPRSIQVHTQGVKQNDSGDSDDERDRHPNAEKARCV